MAPPSVLILIWNLYDLGSDPVDNCQPQPCQNEGECIDEINGYSCSCPAGYTQQDCGAG